jgi:Methyltransferase domain
MSPVVDSFERKARRIRREVRRLPLLEPLANRAGMIAWRLHLRRLARRGGGVLDLPEQVTIDPDALDPGPQDGGRTGDEVAVAFDRAGRVRLAGGRALVEEARRRGSRELTARVARRHRRWARIASEVRAYAAQRGGSAYQPYLHPDLADVPSDQGHERFDLLLDALPVRSGTLIDLGANAGYFSHRFEAMGFDCVAVERSEKEAYFLAALRNACGRDFRILKGSLTRVPLPARVEVVLALNIFHHFLKAEASYRELQRFLARLDTRFMLFEPHLAGDPQMARAPFDMAPERFVERVAEWSGLEVEREIGTAADGRPIYLLAALSSS